MCRQKSLTIKVFICFFLVAVVAQNRPDGKSNATKVTEDPNDFRKNSTNGETKSLNSNSNGTLNETPKSKRPNETPAKQESNTTTLNPPQTSKPRTTTKPSVKDENSSTRRNGSSLDPKRKSQPPSEPSTPSPPSKPTEKTPSTNPTTSKNTLPLSPVNKNESSSSNQPNNKNFTKVNNKNESFNKINSKSTNQNGKNGSTNDSIKKTPKDKEIEGHDCWYRSPAKMALLILSIVFVIFVVVTGCVKRNGRRCCTEYEDITRRGLTKNEYQQNGIGRTGFKNDSYEPL